MPGSFSYKRVERFRQVFQMDLGLDY